MKKNGKARKTTGGTTMVEVIVAFTILVLLMGMFSQAMGLAGRMMNRSKDTTEKYHELAGDYFLGRLTGDETLTALEFKRVTKDGKETNESFSIQVKVTTYIKAVLDSSEISLYEAENTKKLTSSEPGAD